MISNKKYFDVLNKIDPKQLRNCMEACDLNANKNRIIKDRMLKHDVDWDKFTNAVKSDLRGAIFARDSTKAGIEDQLIDAAAVAYKEGGNRNARDVLYKTKLELLGREVPEYKRKEWREQAKLNEQKIKTIKEIVNSSQMCYSKLVSIKEILDEDKSSR
jgi:hypothetical protein